jgi:uncharacterized Zn finger protein
MARDSGIIPTAFEACPRPFLCPAWTGNATRDRGARSHRNGSGFSPTALHRKLATRIAIAARLIAGELPEEVEQYFREAGVPLFPARKDDLITACSCPDSSNPCKHVAAVYYLLAEQFDHDPFFLLNLRGIGRQEFAAMLGGPQAASDMGESAASEPAPPLTSDLEVFWRAGRLPQIHSGDTTITEQSAPLARRLGNLPFWRGHTDFLEALATMSRGASERAVSLLLRLNL